MQDYQKTYIERNKDRVNIAEIKAREYYQKKGLYITRFGFDEKNEPVPLKYFHLVPEQIRNMPEYLLIGKKSWLLEAKGCRDVLRIKLDDLEGYKFWDKICPIVIFAYSYKYNCCYIFTYKKLVELLEFDGMATKGKYHDNNKEHYIIKIKELSLIGIREIHR